RRCAPSPPPRAWLPRCRWPAPPPGGCAITPAPPAAPTPSAALLFPATRTRRTRRSGPHNHQPPTPPPRPATAPGPETGPGRGSVSDEDRIVGALLLVAQWRNTVWWPRP